MTNIVASTMINAERFFGPLRYYEHFAQPKGLALLINNYHFGGEHDRVGSEIDFANLTLLLKQLDYEIEPYWDLTKQQMLDVVDNFVRKFEKGSYQSCVVVLMTHGSLGYFYGIDGSRIKEGDFMKPIQRCKSMRKLPKIFFIQACRDDETHEPYTPRTPAGYETFIFHSTSPRCFSFRNASAGSWFVQALCKIIGRDAHDEKSEIQKLAKDICNEVSNFRRDADGRSLQVPVSSIANVTKKFHFFPTETVFS